ncbi:T9SS-dependent choice-of-anchor J family protein [Epilithonimonas arachidiradicis]|uniref:Putative secreted protein (Por secretion system target) n=1 Tax=Epilithonimonas arachidiradicis TaxID=1617282 RepID=A0A420DCV4_9FLAO|nr:choice-of-anchor J domain-containing protein [Epilithonimonas arachidiradicis]RKE89616.1 putative secreted protein (Por secretion system target) [Epilithonimonas arachidiradicis]GGG43960.1 hypothetical protein GCM10007332_01740 [Epilithonimonas arachidiradicis]
MKKLLFSILFASLLASGQASVSIYKESFEEITSLQDAGWVMYNDSNTPYGTYATLFPNAWNIVNWEVESGNHVASSPSWFTSVTQADRWLISPPITLPSNDAAILSFFARSHDTSPYNDGFKLKISTTNTAKESFNNIQIIDHAPNVSISEQTEPYGVNLSSYAGKTIYLAWVNDYTNGNLLSIDDIDVFITPLIAVNEVNKKDLILYPNPTADYFTISDISDIVSVNIYDLSGKMIKSNFESVNNKFDVSNLEKGIYTVSIETKSGIISKKIVKK